MVEGEDENFLRFATALKMIVGRSIRLEKLPKIKSLLQTYLVTFAAIYGRDEMKPNHHWAVHVPDQLVDFGPVYNFWAFLTERLNKLLKNLNSNNWTGGALEVSMMREFHRNSAVDSTMLSTAQGSPSGANETEFIRLLAGSRNVEAVGTVQDAAHSELTLSRIKFGTVAQEMKPLSDDDTMRIALVRYYNQATRRVHLNPRDQRAGERTSLLIPYADAYNYALLDGRRITPTSRSTRNTEGSSIIQVMFGSRACAGVVRAILLHRQPGVRSSVETMLLMVQWMVESPDTPLDNNAFIWDKFPELGINTWLHEQYEDPKADGSRPVIIPLSDVQCQISRGTLKHTDPPMWITTTMDRVSEPLMCIYPILSLMRSNSFQHRSQRKKRMNNTITLAMFLSCLAS
ncbi:hypothetical protein C8J57DRAFT_1073653 [Mycena rebaudengoi]|nr:hypothetical protein C8J57DRAFT_1073653 [Mycena rebaudengoi]